MEQKSSAVPVSENETTYVYNNVLKFCFGPEFGTIFYTPDKFPINQETYPLAHYLKISSDTIHQIRSKPDEKLVISALLDNELVAQCFATDFDSHRKSFINNLKKLENSDDENLKKYVKINKKVWEAQVSLKEELSKMSIKSVAFICATIIDSSRFVSEIGTVFDKQGGEQLKKHGYDAVVVVAQCEDSSRTMSLGFDFIPFEFVDYSQRAKKIVNDSNDDSDSDMECDIVNGYTILYKIL